MTQEELKLIEKYKDVVLIFEYAYKHEFFYSNENIQVRAIAEYRSSMNATMTIEKIIEECGEDSVSIVEFNPKK